MQSLHIHKITKWPSKNFALICILSPTFYWLSHTLTNTMSYQFLILANLINETWHVCCFNVVFKLLAMIFYIDLLHSPLILNLYWTLESSEELLKFPVPKLYTIPITSEYLGVRQQYIFSKISRWLQCSAKFWNCWHTHYYHELPVCIFCQFLCCLRFSIYVKEILVFWEN